MARLAVQSGPLVDGGTGGAVELRAFRSTTVLAHDGGQWRVWRVDAEGAAEAVAWPDPNAVPPREGLG